MTLSGLIAAGFVVLYFHQVVGLSEFQFSGLLVGLAVPVLLLGLPLGHAADRWGKSRAVRVGLVVAALSLAAVPSCRSIASLAAVGMVLVLSQILAIPAWLALVSELAPTVKRGELMGLVMTAEGVGGAIGPIIGGWMWDWRPGYLFYASAVAMGAAAVVAAVALRTRRSAVPG
jgi:MFS family permease